MNCTISSIHYCPVKSVSFQSIQSCEITKNLGMANDRMFAFSRSIDLEKAKADFLKGLLKFTSITLRRKYYL